MFCAVADRRQIENVHTRRWAQQNFPSGERYKLRSTLPEARTTGLEDRTANIISRSSNFVIKWTLDTGGIQSKRNLQTNCQINCFDLAGTMLAYFYATLFN